MTGSIEAVGLGELSEQLGALRLGTEEAHREMQRSLERHGQSSPVLVCRTATTLELVDGFKRLGAARSLSWSELRAEVREGELRQAKLWVFQCNSGRGLTDFEQAWVVRSWYRQDGLTQPQIARLVCRDKSWVCRRLMLAEGLAAAVEADVRLGLVCSSAAREVVRLPRGNQEACARVVVRRGLTTRQTAKLVDRLLEASHEAARSAILAQAEAGEGLTDPQGRSVKRTLSHGEWLSVEAATVKRAAVRLHARLLQRPLASLGEQASELARYNLRDLTQTLVSLNRTLERVCNGTSMERPDAALS
jgi:ParB-like chromosome segregation protein Spo0J